MCLCRLQSHFNGNCNFGCHNYHLLFCLLRLKNDFPIWPLLPIYTLSTRIELVTVAAYENCHHFNVCTRCLSLSTIIRCVPSTNILIVSILLSFSRNVKCFTSFIRNHYHENTIFWFSSHISLRMHIFRIDNGQ